MSAIALPDEGTPAGIAARRKLFESMEDADIETLGPCPDNLYQTSIDVPVSNDFVSHAVLVYPRLSSGTEHKQCPLIIYIHGGSFTYNTPKSVLSPARAFAALFGAVVACPSYKLAPEHPFPSPVQTAWNAVSWLSQPEHLNEALRHDRVQVDPSLGCILAGFSAGANMAGVIAGIAAHVSRNGRDLITGLENCPTPFTGLFLSIPKFVDEDMLPGKYAAIFRSRVDNANAPIVNLETLRNSNLRLKPDVHSPWFSPLNLDLSKIRRQHPQRVYVQCGELDILRDDGVIYERVLRDMNVASTKIDILKGYDHQAWANYPFPKCHSDEIRQKSLDGMGWLLDKTWDRTQPLPY